MATTLAENIALDKVQDHYVSKSIPQRMGNSAPIAYGGYVIALSIHAACQAAPDGFHLYSAFGHYLSAVNTETNLICKPNKLRQSRSFVTYRVAVEQKDPKTGKLRPCMELLADFHKDEPSLLSYSPRPTRSYSHWKECVPWDRHVENDLARSGKISKSQYETFKTLFRLSHDLWENRPCPEGITSQNLMGLGKTVETSQDHLPPMAKSSAEWIKVKHPLPTEAEQMAGLGFIMDGILSFLPLAHNHLYFDDVDACSTLDFALRVFTPNPRMDEWRLRELLNHQAGQGRTYSESRLWDEHGNLVACMTQQSILRVFDKAAKI